MTNKEIFIEVFKRDPITDACPIYCSGEHGEMCPYEQPRCVGSWWHKEYEVSDNVFLYDIMG